jgi:hypothetical protein
VLAYARRISGGLSWLFLVDRQLQEAVTTAHETTTEFNDEIIKEHNIFELSKQQEMKEMLGNYADGHIDFYRKVSIQ